MPLTPEQVAQYRTEYKIGVKPDPKKTGFFRDLVGDLKETGQNMKSQLDKTAVRQGEAFKAGVDMKQSKAETVFQFLGETARGTARILGEGFKGGVKAVLPEKAEEKVRGGIASVSQTIAASPNVQNIVAKIEQFKQTNPRAARNLEGALGFGELALEATGAGQLRRPVQTALRTTETLIQSSKRALGGITATGTEGIKQATSNALNPANIMQRVARISKGKQAKFQEMAGESVGEYLVKRNLFGDVNKITTDLYARFRKSKDEVDNGLASLEGNYKSTAVGTALKELAEREVRLSRPGAVSKSRDRVIALQKKPDFSVS